jgi:hypothetical protein
MSYPEFERRVERVAPWVDARAREGRSEISRLHPADVLAELSVLLEEYAPTWYSEKLRHRILAAQRFPTEVLVEICALLEDHAPAWYTEEQQGRALGSLQALGLLDLDDVEGN